MKKGREQANKAKGRGSVEDTQGRTSGARRHNLNNLKPGNQQVMPQRSPSMERRDREWNEKMDQIVNVNQIRIINDPEEMQGLPQFLQQKINQEVRQKIKSGIMWVNEEGYVEMAAGRRPEALSPRSQDVTVSDVLPGTSGGARVGASAMEGQRHQSMVRRFEPNAEWWKKGSDQVQGVQEKSSSDEDKRVQAEGVNLKMKSQSGDPKEQDAAANEKKVQSGDQLQDPTIQRQDEQLTRTQRRRLQRKARSKE